MFPNGSRSDRDKLSLQGFLKPGAAFVAMIFCALVAFEIFNFSTTEYALRDLLGDLTFGGLYWATILSIAFCGIDFAGIARLFTPEQGGEEPKEVWYLFGAWLLAATMNAVLTWWGVSMAVVNHKMQSTSVIDPNTITSVVPVFVAIMVWVIRILIIGTLSLALDRLLQYRVTTRTVIQNMLSTAVSPNGVNTSLSGSKEIVGGFRSPSLKQRSAAPRSASSQEGNSGREAIESTYHNLAASVRPREGGNDQPRGRRFS